jgi:hypothetical protein
MASELAFKINQIFLKLKFLIDVPLQWSDYKVIVIKLVHFQIFKSSHFQIRFLNYLCGLKNKEV